MHPYTFFIEILLLVNVRYRVHLVYYFIIPTILVHVVFDPNIHTYFLQFI